MIAWTTFLACPRNTYAKEPRNPDNQLKSLDTHTATAEPPRRASGPTVAQLTTAAG